jgi:glycosyltransferase involved in cell wall biosynthesis
MDYTYYVFFPVRDGEKTIKSVMDSLINQTIQPKKIIVVDDGSSDKTTEILSKFQNSKLISIIRTESKTRDFKRIPKLWNMCLQKEYDFQMIGAGDCIFENTYAEKILQKFSEDSKLVVASGDFKNGKSHMPHGAGRFVKQDFFFSNYEKYPDIIGYETEILLKAELKKYNVKIFNKIVFDHVDELGHSHNFSEFGQGMRALGYHPLYVFGRFILEIFGRGEINTKGALNMIWKYITYRPKTTGYYSQFPKEFREEIKKDQWKTIKEFFLKKIKLH